MATPAANFRDAIPRPSEQPLEVDYLQNRHPEYSNDNIVFDPENKKFVPQPLPIAVRRVSFDTLSLRDPHAHELQIVRTTESFKNAVERLVKQKSKDKQLAEFNLSNVTSWSDVNTIMAGAEKKYANMDSTSGKIRNFFHKIGDNGKSIKSFVGLLPDGNYKTLCGGLTLILSVSIRSRSRSNVNVKS
jgi:hypothetical protein